MPFILLDRGSGSELCEASFKSLRGKAIVPSLRGETCAKIVSDTDVFLCSFEFAFRSGASKALYDEFVQELMVCHGGDEYVEWTEGVPVNHPDSYEQTTFEHYEGLQVSGALKDKGALQKTYVFVRLPAH